MKNCSIFFTILIFLPLLVTSCQPEVKKIERPEKIVSKRHVVYDDNTYDKIFTANTIYFYRNPDHCLKEVLRVLKIGGTFYCGFRSKKQLEDNEVTNYGNFVKYHENEVKDLLNKIGFKNVELSIKKDVPLDSIIAIGTKE